MKTISTGIGLMTAALLAIPGAVPAQAPGAVTLFSQPDFAGSAVTLNARRNDVRLEWPVRSVRIDSGPGWRLCTRTNLRDCTSYTQHRGNVRFVLRSAEPIPGPPPRPQPGSGVSLRGMAAEYFPAPSDNRGRIVSCASGASACALDSANRFCRSRGWNRAAFNLQETVSRQNFLADVLCVNIN
jgi:hypothetical protein